MFCNVNRNGSRWEFSVEERFFARQTKRAVLDQRVFDPFDGVVNVADNRVVFISEVFHCLIGSPVLEREEESVFDSQFRGRLAAEPMKFFEGFLENFQHVVKGFSFDTEELFEFSVAERQCFLHVFGLDEHGRQKGKNVRLTENSRFCKMPQCQNHSLTNGG